LSLNGPLPLRIPYFVIIDDSYNTHLEVPSFYLRQWLWDIQSLPQNVLHLVDNQSHAFMRFIQGHTDSYDIRYLHINQLKQHSVNAQALEPIPFGVIFFTTASESDLSELEIIFNDFIIVATTDDEQKLAQKIQDTSKVHSDLRTAVHAIAGGMIAHLKKLNSDGSDNFINDLIQKLTNYQERETNTNKGYNFEPTRTNRSIESLIRGDAWITEYNLEEIDRLSNRSQKILETANCVDEAARKEFYHIPPPIIVTIPFNSPQTFKNFKKNIHRAPSEIKTMLRRYLKMMEQEQHPENYCNSIDANEDDLSQIKNGQFPPELEHAIHNRGFRIRILDCISFLHAAFYFSPVLRAPIIGKSLNPGLSFFDMNNLRINDNSTDILAKIMAVGNDIAKSFPAGFLDYMTKDDRQIVCISDLPVEWTDINGIPLSFLKDVCRIPESPQSLLGKLPIHFSSFHFTIDAQLLSRTMVICTCPDDANIANGFSALKSTLSNLPIIFAECRSLEEIRKLLETNPPDFLIYYGHGVFLKDQEETALSVGNEIMTIDEVLKGGLQAPIMWLCNCNTTPLNGYPNSISQAFIQQGALSVVSSFIPISINEATILCSRLLALLEEALVKYKSKNWLDFTQHFIRTAFISDTLQRVMRANQIKDAVSLTDLKWEGYFKWYDDVQDYEHRASCYNQVADVVIEMFPEELKSVVRNILNVVPPSAEHLYYTHLGRPDLIIFENAVQFRRDLLAKITEGLKK